MKADITIYELGKPKSTFKKSGDYRMDCEESVIRKTTTYYNCAPIKVTNIELDQEGKIMTYSVDFVFNTYSIVTA